jgi:hypothetical protein
MGLLVRADTYLEGRALVNVAAPVTVEGISRMSSMPRRRRRGWRVRRRRRRKGHCLRGSRRGNSIYF